MDQLALLEGTLTYSNGRTHPIYEQLLLPPILASVAIVNAANINFPSTFFVPFSKACEN